VERHVQITADGSATIAIPAMQVTYHSKHGAVQESMHVFIQAGLTWMIEKGMSHIRIFEMGFGTGLNALLTVEYVESRPINITYYSAEAFPLTTKECANLNYTNQAVLQQLHNTPWNEASAITSNFTLHKLHASLDACTIDEPIDLIYYDAFAPSAQPGLWTESIFAKLFHWTVPGGILVTYCSKGDVRRAMQAAGWIVEKIPGPPGKREMVRAHKPA
jgi:tRNA U34 5-methylaminomethyl-2-thiouridine-forming methyltransferase MnmC